MQINRKGKLHSKQLQRKYKPWNRFFKNRREAPQRHAGWGPSGVWPAPQAPEEDSCLPGGSGSGMPVISSLLIKQGCQQSAWITLEKTGSRRPWVGQAGLGISQAKSQRLHKPRVPQVTSRNMSPLPGTVGLAQLSCRRIGAVAGQRGSHLGELPAHPSADSTLSGGVGLSRASHSASSIKSWSPV